jgi:hypothetical protein
MSALVVVEGEEGEPVSVVEVALSTGKSEEQDRPCHQGEADEDLED